MSDPEVIDAATMDEMLYRAYRDNVTLVIHTRAGREIVALPTHYQSETRWLKYRDPDTGAVGIIHPINIESVTHMPMKPHVQQKRVDELLASVLKVCEREEVTVAAGATTISSQFARMVHDLVDLNTICTRDGVVPTDWQ